MIIRQRFPIVTGWIVSKLGAGFVASGESLASGVTVAGVRPDVFPARLVTVRDDSGPQSGVSANRRVGVNVWHTDSVSCERLAQLGMAILGSSADGAPVTAVSNMAGPFRIDDDPIPSSGNVNLTHFYFTATVTVRPTSF